MSVRERFEKIISQRVLTGDGAIGTLLQARGLPAGKPPESMMLNSPEEVEAVHRLYFEAGAEILTTNTFGANRLKLEQYGLAGHIHRINSRAVEAARNVAADIAFVAGCVGPTGELLRPMGKRTVPELVEIYREQIQILRDAGADFAILETMSDIGELQAAARACHIEQFPFVASMTYNENGRSLTGATPEVTAVTLEPFEPLAIGVNCGLGPAEMLQRVKEYALATHLPLLAQPNAGLPKLVGKETVFQLPPDQFADHSAKLARAGAAVVGGCCGTTPQHIRALRNAVNDYSPSIRGKIQAVRFSARSGCAVAGFEKPFCIIGERINPTGRKRLSNQMRNSDFSRVRKDASRQVERGANLLDINVGVPETDETALMLHVIDLLQSMHPGTPLSIDSNDPAVLAVGLKHVVGRSLLNSINGDDERMDALLPIVAETGANFIALAMDETGMPKTADERLKIIKRILKRAEEFGIDRNRVLVDTLVFTVASEPRQPMETLVALKRIRQELGCASVLGVSNVSFGLPGRDVITSSFLAMAMVSGLTAGIVNPLSDRIVETIRATELLLNKDSGAVKYVSAVESIGSACRPEIKTSALKIGQKIEPESVLNYLKDGDREGLIAVLDTLMAGGKSPDKILSGELAPAIQKVGDMYGCGTIYLPQLILAGEAMRAAVAHIRPLLSKYSGKGLHGTPLIIGTVEGDIHDIGKNIVAIVMENRGFKVHDLGKNIAPEKFLQMIDRIKPTVVALSALMTTTMPAMENTVRELKRRYPDVRVMVGGAVVTQKFADRIGADGYASEAVGAGTLALELAGLQ
jgi:5-methyltetrahydrofolate--homocysteine methyltransferase